jgi:hypothetical protein
LEEDVRYFEKCNTKTPRYEDTKSEDEISHQIIGASIEVHPTLGWLWIYERKIWLDCCKNTPTEFCDHSSGLLEIFMKLDYATNLYLEINRYKRMSSKRCGCRHKVARPSRP